MTNVSSTNLFHHLGGFTADDNALSFKGHHVKICQHRAHRRTHSCPLGLLKIIALEQEIGVAKAKLQQVHDVLGGHGGSLVEFCILFQFLLYYFQCRFYWDRCKEGSHIIRHDTLSLLQLYLLDIICKFFGV